MPVITSDEGKILGTMRVVSLVHGVGPGVELR